MENYEAVITQNPGSIQCDFETAKAYLEKRLGEYRGIIFTEESRKAAKETVASLRKEKKAFADRVKEAKEAYLAPFEAFYAQAKELIDLYDAPINFINGQVAEFERKRVEEKRQLVKELYEECISDLSDFLPLQKIYDPKWENASTSQKAIRAALMSCKEAAKSAIETIRSMESDAEEEALRIYQETLDLPKAVQFVNQHEQQKAQILAREQERIRREEEERIRREERQRLEAERRAQEEMELLQRAALEEKEAALRQAEEEKRAAVEQAASEAAQEAIESLIPDMSGETNLYEYRMELTADQKEKLETYLDSVGIEWEMI